MKKTLITLLASFFLFSTSYAIDYNIGVSGSIGLINAEGDEKETSNTGVENSSRAKNVDNIAGIGSIFFDVGFDNGMRVGASVVPMAADVSDKTHKRTDTSVAASGEGVTGTNTRTADAEVEMFRTFYLEYPLSGATFVKLGYSQIDVNTKENNLTNGGKYKDATIDGVTFGLGLDGELGGYFTRTSVEHTDFDEYASSSGTGNKITADLDVTEVKFSIGKTF